MRELIEEKIKRLTVIIEDEETNASLVWLAKIKREALKEILEEFDNQ